MLVMKKECSDMTDIMYCKAVKGVLSPSFICFWTTIYSISAHFKCIVNKGRFRENF